MDCFGAYFIHVQTCDSVRVQNATQWTASPSATEWTPSVHTLHMSKPVITFVFNVLRNGLLPYILYTCPNLWKRSCSKCYAMDCFGTYFAHVQTCDNVRVQSATQWTASVHTLHMSKPVITFGFKVLYGMDCFGTYFTHVQTCDNVRVQSATQWTASVHTLHMSKPVITFVFKVLYGMDSFGTYFAHVQTCDNVRVQSATEWTASVPTLHMSKPVITFVFKVLRNGLLRYILYTCPNLW